MNTKLKEIIRQLLVSPLRFPVEAALGLAFFIMAVWHSESSYPMSETVKQLGNILWLFVPLMTLSFWLQRINRWVYYVSFFLFIPLLALDLEPFLETYGFRFTYVLAAILLIIGNKKLDNRSFAAHALHVVTQMFFGVMITGIFNLVVMAICASFFYIFGIDEPRHFYEHIIQFVWFVLAPQICCTFVRQNEDEVVEPFKVLRLILNFILSPAIIIYTVILYIYFIKIALEWDLPKGGVAWMVMGFISAALVGRMAQSILSQRYYDWFYRHFTLIAIPPLIMYWIGSIYRIRIYSFTESRFYLMVAGVLMTLFVLMLFWKRTRHYQLMALIFGTAIILFTYIPGISAKSIGLNCQKQRLQEVIHELKLTDVTTGKLIDKIDMTRIKQDSLLCEKYRDATSVICYVRDEIGNNEFEKQYGEWDYHEYNFNLDENYSQDNWHERKKPVELDDYSIMLPEEKYRCDFDRQTVIVKKNDAVVLEYPIASIIRQDTILLHHPEQLFSYRNDSLLLVLNEICINDSVVTGVRTYDFRLFKKSSR